MKKGIKQTLLIGVIGFSLVARFPITAEAGILKSYNQSYDAKNNTVIYTINENAGATVTFDCNDVASSLMFDVTQPGETSEINIKIVNNSDTTYIFKNMKFNPENHVDRDIKVKDPKNPKDIVRTEPPEDEGTICSTTGFDGNKIPYGMNVLRCVTQPLMDMYNKNHPSDVTLSEVQNATEKAKEMGYNSYSDYLLQYYKSSCSNCRNANSLMELEPEHIAEILGSGMNGFRGQSEIRYPRTIKADDITNGNYDNFIKYGWASIKTDDNGNKFVSQDYEIMETEDEIIKLGYWYLYQYGMRLTFDAEKYPLTYNDETETGGLQIYSYLYNLGKANEIVTDIFKNMTIYSEGSKTIDNVQFAAQLPNAYDLREMDFGFTMTFVAVGGNPDGGGGGGNPDPPVDPEKPPTEPEEPPVDIEDPDVPLVEPEPEPDEPSTEPEEPSVDIEEPDVPLVPWEEGPEPGDPENITEQGKVPTSGKDNTFKPSKTGDESNIFKWIVIEITSICLIIFVIYLRKRNKNE